jgi:hypothetical protein
MAVNFLSEIPLSENRKLTERYTLINFNLVKISQDEAILPMLKHISYITSIELNLKKDLLLPQLRALEVFIDKELQE